MKPSNRLWRQALLGEGSCGVTRPAHDGPVDRRRFALLEGLLPDSLPVQALRHAY